ncbi:MAG: MATE family efflux transporter [Proteobacteria bacterium]|nr:MATE family efflux transporter [Pseudomonadota bacterium]
MSTSALTLPPRRARAELAELLSLAGPVIAARIGIMVMGLTDAVVVGRYSATELGYHALGWAPTSILLTTGVGLLLGVQVMTSQAIGEGRPDHAGLILRRGIAYALQLGLVAAGLLFALGPALLGALRLEPDLARGAARALQVFALSLPPYLVAVACSFFLEATRRAAPAMVIMWLANGLNLLVNLLLVPGTLGLPALGAVGSAWATFGARTALMVMSLVYIARLPEAGALGLFARPPRDRQAEAAQRRIGYAAGASYAIEVGAFAGMNFVAAWVSQLAVAAYAVVLNVTAIIFMAPLGLAGATAVLVGRAYGARNRHEVVRAGVLGLAVCAVLATVIALIVWPGARLITSAYTTQPELLDLAAGALALCTVFFVVDALQVVAAQALRARGDVWLPTAMHLVSYGLIMAPLGWFLAEPAGLGLNGIIWAIIIASFVSAALLVGRFAWLARQPLPAG